MGTQRGTQRGTQGNSGHSDHSFWRTQLKEELRGTSPRRATRPGQLLHPTTGHPPKAFKHKLCSFIQLLKYDTIKVNVLEFLVLRDNNVNRT